jgi:post-segregation antitoxin (ccd killing protein)
MGKVVSSVSLDPELHEYIKRSGLNLSSIVEETIRKQMRDEEDPEVIEQWLTREKETYESNVQRLTVEYEDRKHKLQAALEIRKNKKSLADLMKEMFTLLQKHDGIWNEFRPELESTGIWSKVQQHPLSTIKTIGDLVQWYGRVWLSGEEFTPEEKQKILDGLDTKWGGE